MNDDKLWHGTTESTNLEGLFSPLSQKTKLHITSFINQGALMRREDLKGVQTLMDPLSTRTDKAVSHYFKLAPPK
jgi:hypothetical protein